MKSNKRVCALGFFDGVHLGHGKIIKEAVSLAASLGAGPAVITFDRRPKSFILGTADRLISPGRAKEKLISLMFPGTELITITFNAGVASLSPEDFVNGLLIGQFGACGAAAGLDHRFGKDALGDINTLSGLIKTSPVPTVELDGVKVSSTNIRAALSAGDFELALAYLGHPFLLCGKVEHGDGRGHNIGFATLNLPYDKAQLYPAEGVYASVAEIDGKLYPGVTNLGHRPTFYDDGIFTNETHLIGCSPDLYSKEVWLWLCGYIRPERRFDSAAELKAQVDEDIAASLKITENCSFFAEILRRN